MPWGKFITPRIMECCFASLGLLNRSADISSCPLPNNFLSSDDVLCSYPGDFALLLISRNSAKF